jgi:hypothetical protein
MAQPGTNESATSTETGSTFAKGMDTSPNGKQSPSIKPVENGLIQELFSNGLDTLVERDVEKAEITNGVQDDKQADLVSISSYCSTPPKKNIDGWLHSPDISKSKKKYT